MGLARQHLGRTTEERLVGKQGRNRAACELQFNRADMVLQQVVADICNGFSINDIIMKFAEKQYEHQKKPIKEAQAKNYIKMAYEILKENNIKEQDKLRDQLYNQYLAIFNDCIMNGNTITAKQVLDSICKTFLPEEKNINLSGNIDSNVTIDFNFNNED